MKFELPPPLTQPPPPRSAWQDFILLSTTELRVTWNKLRHWPPVSWITIILAGAGCLAMLAFLGTIIYGALQAMEPQIARWFLSVLFMIGLAVQLFFGITAAFATLYMSDDLELLFMAPIPARVVFAAKSLVVAGSTFLTAALFVFVPGVFYGLLCRAGAVFYIWAALAGIGLWATGTALAELANLWVMRIVPPHRSREAIGVIGCLAGIMIALVCQIPNLLFSSGSSGPSLNIGSWLAGRQQLLQVMDYFPWGWGSLALAGGASGNHPAGLGWSLLLLALGAGLFILAFLSVERGFRRGWIALSQGEGGRRRKGGRVRVGPARHQQRQEKASSVTVNKNGPATASAWRGMWAVAGKDLLYMRRDTREWLGYTAPLIIMAFFVGRFLLMPEEAARSGLVSVLVIYTIIFSGNLALQSFGREGESEWILNSVPLAGWPVVWGKLLAAVLPTLVLMEALLAGTALAVGLSPTVTLGLAVGAVFITLEACALGLFYSINNCRYNPQNPQQRISPGAAMVMSAFNMVFIALMAFGLLYVFPPAELLAVLQELAHPSFSWGFPDFIIYLLYVLGRPLFWPPAWRVIAGMAFTGGVWSAVFFGFMAATVRQSRKGFRVEIVTTPARSRLGRR